VHPGFFWLGAGDMLRFYHSTFARALRYSANWVLATVALIAVGLNAGIAFAADMPAQAPVYTRAPVAVPYSWTGFYVGGSVGEVWGDVSNNWNLGPNFVAVVGAVPGTTALTNQPFHATGVIWGGQLGYNYQIGSLVAGFEADVSGTRLSSSRTSSLTGVGGFVAGAFTTETAKSDYLATVRARLGYTANSWLLYGTGGLAVADAKYTDFLDYNNVGATQFAQSSQTRIGWTVGGGVEYAFTRNWSAKAEYLYVDLGSNSSAVSSLAPLGRGNGWDITHQHSLTEEIGRVGVNYKLY
jgi:outer membrane immunogenic protein